MLTEDPCNTEVDELHLAVVAPHDVLGLEIAMDQAGSVGGGESSAGLDEDLEYVAPPRLGLEPGGDALTTNELHGQVKLTMGVSDLVHGDDVGVGHASQRQRLATEPEAVVLAGQGVIA